MGSARVRPAAFAGRFYPREAQACEAMFKRMRPQKPPPISVGGLVPHAGWIYSGPTAALTIASLAGAEPETVVIFGAVHVLDRNDASLFDSGEWETPIGKLVVDEELARAVARCRHVRIDPQVHAGEHSIEVELPLILGFLGNVRILPLMVRPGPHAAEIGRRVALAAQDLGRRVVFLASTDLTHYGPAFGFEPAGRGEVGVRWAKEVNDRRFLRVVEQFDVDGVVPEASLNRNACGAGAVAATLAALREYTGTRPVELQHTCSAEVERSSGERPLNSVGYASVVFCEAGERSEPPAPAGGMAPRGLTRAG